MSDWKPQCHRREETFQVVIDLVKNSSCFTISTDVPEIFMTILDICLRVEGVNFTNVPDDDTALAFLIKLGEDCQEYGLSIPETMLTEAINNLNPIRCSSSILLETVDVYEESEPEPESVKRRTSSKRRVKKKVTLFADDNIISNDPDTALELGKSISQTKAKEAEAARQVHATHKNKRLQTLCKLLRKARRQARDRQVVEAQVKELVLYQGFLMSPHSSLLPQVKELWGLSKQESEYSEEDKLDDEEKDDKEGDADDEDDETESEENDIYKYKIRVHKDEDEDEEMINVEVDDSNKGDEEVTDAAKAYAEKTS
ncbi:hypothetical protein Tco_1180199 [Tanacetum coccineum]